MRSIERRSNLKEIASVPSAPRNLRDCFASSFTSFRTSLAMTEQEEGGYGKLCESYNQEISG